MKKNILLSLICILISISSIFSITSFATVTPAPGAPPVGTTPAPSTPDSTAKPKATTKPGSASAKPATTTKPKPTEKTYTMNDVDKNSNTKEKFLAMENDGSDMQKKAMASIRESYSSIPSETVSVVFQEMKKTGAFDTNNETLSHRLYELFAIIGYGLVGFYFIMALIDKSTMNQLNIEQFFKILLSVIFAKCIIENGWTMICQFYNIGYYILNGVTSFGYKIQEMAIPFDAPSIVDDVNMAFDSEFVGAFVVNMTNGPSSFLAGICTVVASVIVWSLFIELIVKSILSPIAFADIAFSGVHGPGVQYMKKLIALNLQFAAIVLALLVCKILEQSFQASVSSSVWSSFVINLVTIAMITKAASFVGDLTK